MTKIINIFGGPGIGKSTVIAGLFHEMKINNMNVEVANEVAKDMVWENRFDILREDQLYVFAKQHRRIWRLINKVDYVIADCPLLMCIPYIADGFYKNLEPLIAESWANFDNVSIVLNRPQGVEYVTSGRYHDERQSEQLHVDIVGVLHQYQVPYLEFNVRPETPKDIMTALF